MATRGAAGIRLDRSIRSRWIGVAIGAVVFAVLLAARSAGWLEPLELGTYDRYVRWRAALRAGPAVPAPEVTLVTIDERDVERFRHPLSDADLARAISSILGAEPRALGVDLYRTFPVGEGRAALETLVRSDPRVAFIFQLPAADDAGVPSPDFLAGLDQAAVSDLLPDFDGVVRRIPVFMWDADGRAHLSLSWWVATRYLAKESPPVLPAEGEGADASRSPIALGAGRLERFLGDDGGYVHADDGDYQAVLDYRRGNGAFPVIRFRDVLDGRFDPALLRDRAVLLGTVASSVKDDFTTSLGPPEGEAVTKGVEIHAHAVDQFLRTASGTARPLRTLSRPAEDLWLLLWCLLWGVVGDRVRRLRHLALAGLLGVALLAGSFPLFLAGWWTPVVPPALAWLGAGGLSAGLAPPPPPRDRALLDRMLAVHVSAPVRDRLWAQRERFLEEGRVRAQRTCLTVLMTDLEGFTSASERLGDPGLVMRWLNEFMERMVPIIEAHDGVVDGYWGDAIKADFGALPPRETEAEIDRDAVNAVRCALAMGDAMRELIGSWTARSLPPVRLRVGIFTGPAIAGSLGSTSRQKYTSLGDTVNTAARLESFDKESFAAEADPTAYRVLIGEATRVRIGDAFVLEPLGRHGVKGKGEKVAIFRVRGEAGARQSTP